MQNVYSIIGVNSLAPTRATGLCLNAIYGQVVCCSSSSKIAWRPALRYLAILFAHTIIGVLISITLLSHIQTVARAILAIGAFWENNLQHGIYWLMSAKPAGIKLHLEFTYLMGTAGLWCIWIVRQGLASAPPWLVPLLTRSISCAFTIGGPALGLALCHDLMAILCLPMALAYFAMSALYRSHIRALQLTWGMMRNRVGKTKWLTTWRQSLWAGSEGLQQQAHPKKELWGLPHTREVRPVSMELLIVGVLLFVPLLGLLPTTLSWFCLALWHHTLLTFLRHALMTVIRLIMPWQGMVLAPPPTEPLDSKAAPSSPYAHCSPLTAADPLQLRGSKARVRPTVVHNSGRLQVERSVTTVLHLVCSIILGQIVLIQASP